MQKRKKPCGSSNPKHRKVSALSWLGGPALFGFVSCQAPDSPAGPVGKPKDSVEVARPPVVVKADTVPVIARVDTVPVVITVDTVPIVKPKVLAYAGQVCDSLAYPNYYCDSEKEILACRGGVMVKASPPVIVSMAYRDYVCYSGLSEPISVIVTMGFNGSDAADRSLPRPCAFLRGQAGLGPAVREPAFQSGASGNQGESLVGSA